MISTSLVLLTVVFIAPIFEYLPYCILGGIVAIAALDLIEYEELQNLFYTSKREFLLWVVTFVSTLLLGVINGIVVAVIFSILLVVYRSSYPNIAILGRIPDTTLYRDVHRFPDALVIPGNIQISPFLLLFLTWPFAPTGVEIVRFESSLYYANVEYLRAWLHKQHLDAPYR